MAATQSLYNFMEALNRNSVRTQNLFEMHVFIPGNLIAPGINGNFLTTQLNPEITFYGQGFELPSRRLEYQDVGFKGFTVPVPTVMRMTQEHNVTINADIQGNMRRAFLAWQALTINPQIDPDGGYFEGNRLLSNTSHIWVNLLDPTYQDKDRIVESYTIYGVTVEDVGTMQLSNTESGLATFTVKFRSQFWQYGPPNEIGNAEDRTTSGQQIFTSIK